MDAARDETVRLMSQLRQSAHLNVFSLCTGRDYDPRIRDVARLAVDAVIQRYHALNRRSFATMKIILQEDVVRSQLRLASYQQDPFSLWWAKSMAFDVFFSSEHFPHSWYDVWRYMIVPEEKIKKRRAKATTQRWSRLLLRIRFLSRLRQRVSERRWCHRVEEAMFAPHGMGYAIAKKEFDGVLLQ